ncbi:MAG: cytochrome o ubiquinol oxidase subunit III [Gemmataceae bacterium]
MPTDVVEFDRIAPPAEQDHHDPVATAAFGFWTYIMSDCLLFAALFATFVVLSHNYAGGPSGKAFIDLPYTLGETMLLLCSSVTYGFAVLAMHRRRTQHVVFWLAVTFLLGLGFVGMEINEFHQLVAAGNNPERSGFLSAFFTLVATHGAHVTAGLIWMTVMMAQVITKGLTVPVRSRLMRLSMFWHFLDIVWIGVFTVVYLTGAM